jgi:Uma2 family endonuclease
MIVMGTAVLVSVEEYLHTVYRPDCDYVDGVVEERNLGEYDHARLQGLLLQWLMALEKRLGVWVVPEQRVRVRPTRYRIPDICVVVGAEPQEQVFTKPPFLCIEILSVEDRMVRVQERIDDYLEFGVRYVWLINPQTRKAWIYTSEGAREAKDGVLRTVDPEIAVPLSEVLPER